MKADHVVEDLPNRPDLDLVLPLLVELLVWELLPGDFPFLLGICHFVSFQRPLLLPLPLALALPLPLPVPLDEPLELPLEFEPLDELFGVL